MHAVISLELLGLVLIRSPSRSPWLTNKVYSEPDWGPMAVPGPTVSRSLDFCPSDRRDFKLNSRRGARLNSTPSDPSPSDNSSSSVSDDECNEQRWKSGLHSSTAAWHRQTN